MATTAPLEQLKATLERLRTLENDKRLVRTTLGDESLTNEWTPRLERIRKLEELVQPHAATVHDQNVGQARTTFDQIATQCEQQINRGNSEYITQRQTFLNTIDGLLENANQWLPGFVTAAILDRGFLQDEGIREEYQKTVESLRSEAENTLTSIKAEARRTIDEAKKLAEEIELRARRTATKVSFEAAQSQFAEEQKHHKKSIVGWGTASTVAVLIFLGVVVAFLRQGAIPGVDWHVALFETALRIVILSALGTVAMFCARIFRAHIHMNELNRHRQRVANSMESFVASAQTPEHRDLILMNLVEAVVAFGNSGLLPNDEDTLGAQKLSGEAVGRVLGAFAPKGS